MIKFKTKRIAKEFDDPKLSDDLLSLLYILNAFCGLQFKKDITITDLFRTQEEQDNIYNDYESYKRKKWYSVHQFWRGADIRSRDFTKLEIDEILQFMNLITYDSKHSTMLCHKVSGGAYHLHLQSKK